MKKLRKFTAEIGGAQVLATKLDVSRGLISHWFSGFRPITPEKAKRIELISGGQVTRKDLRPDIFE